MMHNASGLSHLVKMSCFFVFALQTHPLPIGLKEDPEVGIGAENAIKNVCP